MARRRKKRLRWFAGGGLILALVLVLGDPWGMFQRGTEGDSGGAAANRQEGEAANKGDPSGGGSPDKASGRGQGDETKGESNAIETEGDPSDVARSDQVMGIIQRYEDALVDERLGELAALVERVRKNPIAVPAGLRERFEEVQARADAALDWDERLKQLVSRGEILRTQLILSELLKPATPAFMRERLSAATKRFGWPSITREWQVQNASAIAGETDLPKLRHVRFVKDDDLQEGYVWRCEDVEATIRVNSVGGFTYPVVKRHAIEPVQPKVEEAVQQGNAAARAGDAIGVVLWWCHFVENGQAAEAELMKKLMR